MKASSQIYGELRPGKRASPTCRLVCGCIVLWLVGVGGCLANYFVTCQSESVKAIMSFDSDVSEVVDVVRQSLFRPSNLNALLLSSYDDASVLPSTGTFRAQAAALAWQSDVAADVMRLRLLRGAAERSAWEAGMAEALSNRSVTVMDLTLRADGSGAAVGFVPAPLRPMHLVYETAMLPASPDDTVNLVGLDTLTSAIGAQLAAAVGAGLFYFAHPPSVDARTGERVMSIGRPMWTPDAMLPTVSPVNRLVVNETLAQFGLHPCGMPTRETNDAPVQLPPQVAGRPNASITGVISVVVSEASLFKVVGGALRGDFVGIGGYTTSARLRGRLDALALEDVTDIPEAVALTAAAGYPQSLLQPFKQAPPAFPVGRGLPFLAAVHRGNHPGAGGRWNYSRSLAFRPLNSADARLATPQAQELRATGGIDSLRLAPNASVMARLFYPSVATQGAAETGPAIRHRSSWVVGWGGRLLLVSAVSVPGHVYANTSSNGGLLAVSVVSATLAAVVIYTLLLLLYLRPHARSLLESQQVAAMTRAKQEVQEQMMAMLSHEVRVGVCVCVGGWVCACA
jgi:hypothetical protein